MGAALGEHVATCFLEKLNVAATSVLYSGYFSVARTFMNYVPCLAKEIAAKLDQKTLYKKLRVQMHACLGHRF